MVNEIPCKPFSLYTRLWLLDLNHLRPHQYSVDPKRNLSLLPVFLYCSSCFLAAVGTSGSIVIISPVRLLSCVVSLVVIIVTSGRIGIIGILVVVVTIVLVAIAEVAVVTSRGVAVAVIGLLPSVVSR